jgi:bromodomain-containing protein 7/9
MRVQSDFRLVVSNAKVFNPPGTIYHSEAERIEAFGLDRITKAAATVIEYETDWNIEIEGDDDRSVAIDEDNELETPGPPEENRRSPSVASNQPQGNRRGTRTVTTGKKGATSIPESLEADGGLPGAKDGLGVFPPGSDWARIMLALKIKGDQPH